MTNTPSQDKMEKDRVLLECMGCGTEFEPERKGNNFCDNSCYKVHWQKENRDKNRKEYNKKRQERGADAREENTKSVWMDRFEEKASTVHKIALRRFAKKMNKRTYSWKNSLTSRSKKYEVDCDITLDEVRQMMYNAYGEPCIYCESTLDINNLVLDHVVPISKQGTSNPDNLQVICKKCNAMKGSLDEDNFELLLEWLRTIPEELANDISIRLSHGII